MNTARVLCTVAIFFSADIYKYSNAIVCTFATLSSQTWHTVRAVTLPPLVVKTMYFMSVFYEVQCKTG